MLKQLLSAALLGVALGAIICIVTAILIGLNGGPQTLGLGALTFGIGLIMLLFGH